MSWPVNLLTDKFALFLHRFLSIRLGNLSMGYSYETIKLQNFWIKLTLLSVITKACLQNGYKEYSKNRFQVPFIEPFRLTKNF